MAGLPAIYKRYQGQYARGVTAAVLAAVLLATCYFTYTILATYVAAEGTEGTFQAPQNVGEGWVFDEAWPEGGAPRFDKGEPVTAEAIEALKTAGVDRWRFRQANTVPFALYIHYGVPVLMLVAGGVGIYMLSNKPKLADFLIATEGEMKKVSWSSRAELIGSTAVVIVTMAILGALIYTADLVWISAFRLIGVLPKVPPTGG